MGAALYIHIPFCTKRCGYCDFYTVAGQENAIPAYVQAVQDELARYAADPYIQSLTFETLYFGGGTPSLLSPAQLGAIIERAQALLHFAQNTELTVEANPGTVDVAKLSAYREAGVNRISIGIQSFCESELHFLERNHTVDVGVQGVEDARKAGFENISIDLIFALPGQTPARWQENLRRAVELQPQHISAYNLTYEPGTPLTTRLQQQRFRKLSEAGERALQVLTIEILQQHDYGQYEISNFAKSGFASHHNQKYWDGSPYLGIGAAAHSFLQNRRFWNVSNYTHYIRHMAQGDSVVAGEEQLQPDVRSFELLYLGLRQRKGVDLSAFEREVGVSLIEKYAAPLSRLFDRSFDDSRLNRALTEGCEKIQSLLLTIEGGFLKLTDEGLLVCDAICAEFA